MKFGTHFLYHVRSQIGRKTFHDVIIFHIISKKYKIFYTTHAFFQNGLSSYLTIKKVHGETMSQI